MTGTGKALSIDNGKFKIRINLEPRVLLALLAFCENNIVRYFILALSMIPGVGYISQYIVPLLYVILLIECFQKYRIKFTMSEMLVVLFVVFAITFTCLIYPENTKYIFDSTNFWQTIFPCVRFYLVGVIILSDRQMMKTLGIASCWGILVEFLFVILYMVPRGLLTNDEMSRAYQILPNVLIALCYSFNEKKLFGWIFSIIGLGYIVAMGTRGPVIIALAYLIIKFLQVSSRKVWVKVIIVGILTAVGIFVLNSNSYIGLLQFLKIQFGAVGLSTRVLDLAINGNVISHMAGRDELYEMGLSKIAERPILGYGVYGEWPWIGWNIHNMYLEIMIHFGVIIGTLILLWIIKTVWRAYSVSDNYSRDFIIIWVVFVFVRGVFGGSYMQFGMAILIGFCLKQIYNSKNPSDRMLKNNTIAQEDNEL